jgi:hypothetical protein
MANELTPQYNCPIRVTNRIPDSKLYFGTPLIHALSLRKTRHLMRYTIPHKVELQARNLTNLAEIQLQTAAPWNIEQTTLS